MLFNSFHFLYFFLVVLIFFHISPQKFRWVVLLTAGFYFYGSLKIEYLLYLFIPILLVYYLALRLNKTQSLIKRRIILTFGILSTFSLLFVFKYLDLLRRTFNEISGNSQFKALNLILPIGISFYTFKLLSYIIDVYNNRAEAEKHIGYFALYVSYFPQLLAGPIDRAVNFLPELKKKTTFDLERVISGVNLFLWGLFKKTVISNRLSLFVDQVFSNPSENSGINLLFGLYFYSFQIYCDFSGYSDMAIGISRILGYKSMENFNFPYFSKNLTQFWNRWHISLSTWLRDYLFLPIAYLILRKVKAPKVLGLQTEKIAYAGGITITMFLGGLWHGASWTFVIWGIIHGFYLSFAHFSKKIRKFFLKKIKIKKLPLIHKSLSILFTFHFVTFAWVFFRSPSFEKAILYLRNIGFQQSKSGHVHLLFTLIFLLIFIFIEIILYNKKKFYFIKNIPVEFKIVLFVFFSIFLIIFSVDGSNEFIYFQF